MSTDPPPPPRVIMASIPPAPITDDDKGNKSISMATNIYSLPNDLVCEILARLPANFLHQKARLVCPKWNKIIRTEAFIKTQLRHSSYGLVFSSMYLGSPPIYVSATQGRIEASQLSCKSNNHINHITSCCEKGLAVLRSQPQSLHVVNTATKQSLPFPPLPDSYGILHCMDFSISIAYSTASMEYKLILPFLVTSAEPHPLRGSLAILTIGVDKSWRHVEVDHLDEDVRALLFMPPLTTEGFFHWGCGRHCLTMDVETEIFTFRQAPLPSLLPPKCHYHYLSSGRCLTVLISLGKYLWQVWEMEAATGEWRKAVHDIELEDQMQLLRSYCKGVKEVVTPFGWVKYPEVLAFYFDDGGRTCLFYNLDTREISRLELPWPSHKFKAFPYRHSLVWLS